jgi:hypothetical protein
MILMLPALGAGTETVEAMDQRWQFVEIHPPMMCTEAAFATTP